mgnify:CR=1 FL=1
MKYFFQLSDHEARIRKNWAIILIIQFISTWIFNSVFTHFLTLNCFDGMKNCLSSDIGHILIGGLTSLFLFHCAYRKYGNIYLSMTAIYGVICSTSLAIFCVYSMENRYSLLITNLLLIVSNVLYTYLSIRLIQINKKIRSQIEKYKENYERALLFFQSANSKDELNNVNQELQNKNDMTKISVERAIFEAYQKRKAELKLCF